MGLIRFEVESGRLYLSSLFIGMGLFECTWCMVSDTAFASAVPDGSLCDDADGFVGAVGNLCNGYTGLYSSDSSSGNPKRNAGKD